MRCIVAVRDADGKLIADPLTGYAGDGARTLTTIRISDGCGVTVPENDIMDHAALLAQKEGVYVESGSATAAALCKTERATRGQTVVAIIT